MFFIRKGGYKLFKKLIFDSDYFSLQLISHFPFIIRKKSRLIFKTHLSKQIIILIEVITLLFKLKFTISHRKTRKLCRRSLETYYLAIIELNIIPSQVYTVCRVYMDIHCCLKVAVDLVAPTQEQD